MATLTATEEAAAAIREIVPRARELIAGIERPDARAIGVWNAVETALHMTQTAEADLAALTGEVDPAMQRVREETEAGLSDISRLDAMTQEMVARDPERDPAAIGERLTKATDAVARAVETAEDDPLVEWLGGALIPTSTLGVHVVEECLVHGLDIARSQGRPWDVDPDLAALVMERFLIPVLFTMDPQTFVDPDGARGLTGTYEIRLRGVGSTFFVFRDGRLELADHWDGPVDARISAPPREFLLLQLERIGPIRAAIGGPMAVWGRRPWKLAGFMRAVQGP